MVATETLAALTVVSLVGGVFVLFGYDLAGRLVSWVGWVAGAAGGAAVAWLVVPGFVDVTFQGRLAGASLDGCACLIEKASQLLDVGFGCLVRVVGVSASPLSRSENVLYLLADRFAIDARSSTVFAILRLVF